MSREEIKIFHRFLKEHGFYASWVKNVHTCIKVKWYCDNNFKNYNEYMDYVSLNDVVLYCFIFDYSSEGWDFWQNVNSEWKKKGMGKIYRKQYE